MPTVKFTTNITNLIETQGTIIIFRFELDEPPPSAGVKVYLKGNIPQSLTQLDLPAIDIQGGNSIEGDYDFTGFYFNIQSQVGTVSAPIFADGIAEGQQTVVYTLQPGTGYTVDPSASAVTVNFFDDPSQVPPPPPPPNDPPVAVNDSYTTEAATELIVNVGNGVLSNDTDAQTDPLTAQVVQAASNGTLTLNANGAFNYTPNAGFSGTDSFTYLANDSKANSTAATVSITVNPPAPTTPTISFTASPTTLVEANNDSIVLSFQLSEPPPEGGLEVTFDSGVERSLAELDVFSASFNGARLVRANSTSSGVTVRLLQQTATITVPLFKDEVVEGPETFTYTLSPVAGYNFVPGENAITFTINDTALPPNDPPVAVNDSYTTNAATELTVDVANGVLSNDTDAQTDPLTAQVVQAPSNGTLTLNANGAFNYTPNSGFSGTDSFTYLANDGTANSTAATASITVNPLTATIPTISFTANPTTLVEANNDSIVLSFQLSEPPPEGGLEVTFDSGVERSLAELDVFSASFNGARLIRANSTSSGVTVRLLQQTATITVPLFPDEVEESPETFTYTLSPVPGYDFVPGENAITFTINDTALTPILPAINQVSDSVFQLEGSDEPKLQISLIEGNSNQVNELGVFIVDDDKGTINGIEPNSTGYAQAALDRAELIFSAISNSPTGFNQTNLTSLLDLNSGEKLGFFLVQNSTIDAVRSGITSLSEVIFAEPSTQKVETLDDGNYLISWENPRGNDAADFKDLVVKASATNQSLPLGAGLQGNLQGELIDLRDITGQVRAEFGLYREAAFDNLIGFYKVADVDGGIDADGNGTIDIRPSDSGYAKAAVQGRVTGLDLTVNNQGSATFTTNLNGGSIYAPLIIANGKPEAIVDDNPNNDPAVYFAFLGANPSQYDHIRLLGNNTWGFEDLPLGGDMDYNDVIVQANFNLI